MKIAIDFGHGVNCDGGAAGIIKEEDIINNIGRLVANKLGAMGHTVIEVRPSYASSTGDSLSQRVNKANSNNADLFVSIHANAGGGKGTEVFTYNGKEVSQARNVLNNICALGFRNRGIKNGSNLYVVRNTNMTAMLIEICFIDTKSDVDLYNSLGAEKIADAIVKGLVGQTVTVNNTSSNSNNTGNTYENTGIKTSFNAHVRDLQKAMNNAYHFNLLEDGEYGYNTNNALKKVLLKIGTINSVVGWVQCRVGAKVDDNYGSKTAEKVRQFQIANGLVADSIAGYNTICEIIRKYQ